MPVSLDQILAGMPEERRAKIARRAEEIDAEINLRELRRLRKLTQARLSKKLKIGQEGISRMEKRSDLYISTLRSYVEGVGGKLSLVVEFPDQPPVILAGLGLDEEKAEKSRRKTTDLGTKSRPKTGVKARISA
jgi:transcriptional regulator with XRE-family HTH domain